MKIALCTELRNAEWFESRLCSLFAGDGQLVIDELWNEKQLSQALRRSRYHAVVIAMTGPRGLEAAIQAKQLAPETPLVWWSDDENFALIAYQLRIPVFLSIDCVIRSYMRQWSPSGNGGMEMRIALCSYSQKEKETALLMKLGKVDRFDNGVFCVYAMQREGPYDAVVIMEDGARGMNFCMSIRGYSKDVPLLWISDQAEFEPQSRRLRVDDFWVKPVAEHQLGEAVSRLLQGKRGSNESGEKEKYE